MAQAFDWFKDTYFKGKQIVKYFVNPSHALTIFRSNSKLELLKVAKTRFASHYIMLKRLVDVREALATTVVLNLWKKLMKIGDENIREVGALITGYIGSDDFWNEVQNILVITKPIYRLIRLCDKDGLKHRSTLQINVFRSDQAIRRSLPLAYHVPQDVLRSRTATIHVPSNIDPVISLLV